MTQTSIEQAQQDIPIACSLTDAQRAVRGEEITPLFSARQEVRELPDGYALRFPTDETSAPRLLSFITGERACCPFFTFELVFEPGLGPIWLHLRGPAGTKEFVAGMLDYVEEHSADRE